MLKESGIVESLFVGNLLVEKNIFFSLRKNRFWKGSDFVEIFLVVKQFEKKVWSCKFFEIFLYKREYNSTIRVRTYFKAAVKSV